MTPFCTGNIPTMFGVQFLSFLVSIVEKYFDQILITFPCLEPPEQAWSRQSSKSGLNDFGLHPKHTHNVWGAVLIVSRQ